MFVPMEFPVSYTRTRIAPTPSGFLHLGNVLSFVRTAEIAARFGVRVLLRIDDLDRERVLREYVEDIFETLAFLEISWDEGPRTVDEFEREWSQVHRLGLYASALSQLRQSVFACDCSRADVLRLRADGAYSGVCRDRGLDLDGVRVSWRLRTGEEEIAVRVLGGDSGLGSAGGDAASGEGLRAAWSVVGEGSVRVLGEGNGLGEAARSVSGLEGGTVRVPLPEVMRDLVVRKKDGYPAYQLSSVVDDLHFGVDLVVRGNDLWPSTIAQHVVADRLGVGTAFGGITFYHHSLLMGPAGKKLSKSAGDTSVRSLRKKGLRKEDVLALIAGF